MSNTSMSENKFYVTTPIYYVTAKPHLGSLYSTLLADVAARWNKLRGKRVFFLTGTDEHGQKVAQAAEQAGKTPKEFVDSFIDAYQTAWHKYELDYDYFIRTTDPEHVKAVQQWLTQLIAKGDIYKSHYTGWYCTSCETFVSDKESETPLSNGQGPACPSCGRVTHAVSEETYFFKLSSYQDALLKFYAQHPDFITPKERLNEVISFVQSGLKDLSISRTTVTWGIPFPNDAAHVAYVWADALNNYITAIGYGQPGKEELFNSWWPADLQILGKDIVRFHAVYWPAFLMASGLSLPKKLLVHGWIKMDKQKMSKSLGNVVDPIDLYNKYGAEPVRYYLMRKMSITHDSDFTIQDLEQTITSDLANDLGNLLNRMVSLADKHGVMEVPQHKIWSETALALRDECFNTIQEYEQFMQDCLYHMALARLWKFVNSVNAYFHAAQPWKMVGNDRDAFMEVISATCHSLRAVAILAWPVMPHKMEEMLGSLGHTFTMQDIIENLELEIWNEHFMLKKIPTLFEKPEPEITSVTQEVLAALEAAAEAPATPAVPDVVIDDVMKMHLLVGTIEQCEEVPKSDKLYKMQVNFGASGMRQILSGIRKHFTPDELIGKQAVFVFNLKPRMMLGLESQGMMLLAEDAEGKLTMTTVARAVPNGTRLR